MVDEGGEVISLNSWTDVTGHAVTHCHSKGGAPSRRFSLYTDKLINYTVFRLLTRDYSSGILGLLVRYRVLVVRYTALTSDIRD